MKRTPDKPYNHVYESELKMLALARIMEALGIDDVALIAELYRRGCK